MTLSRPPITVLVLAVLSLTACSVEDVRPPISDTTVPGMGLPGGESLLIVGDWGAGTAAQAEVAAEMEQYARQEEVAAIVTTGDNLYSDDVDQLMEPFAWAMERDIPFLIAWGNHDLDSARRIEIIDETFDDPPRWWSHEWGPVDILVLDSTQIDSRPQSRFLVNAMAASNDPTIMAFHHPPFSCGSHGDTENVLTEWVPRFDDDVFLVLSGHEHNYQRFESNDVTYLVTGGGGATLTELDECRADHPRRIAGDSVHHFVALELDDTVSVTAIDSDGNVLDEFSLPLP